MEYPHLVRRSLLAGAAAGLPFWWPSMVSAFLMLLALAAAWAFVGARMTPQTPRRGALVVAGAGAGCVLALAGLLVTGQARLEALFIVWLAMGASCLAVALWVRRHWPQGSDRLLPAGWVLSLTLMAAGLSIAAGASVAWFLTEPEPADPSVEPLMDARDEMAAVAVLATPFTLMVFAGPQLAAMAVAALVTSGVRPARASPRGQEANAQPHR